MRIGSFNLKCTRHAYTRFHERIKPENQLSKNEVLQAATKSISGFSFVWQLQNNKQIALITVLPFESKLKNKRNSHGRRITNNHNQFYS